ncbi:hypothetical protein D910_07420 [Dendroctonus ponderosae]
MAPMTPPLDPPLPEDAKINMAKQARTSWILPFTAGSFLHIGLVTVLPDLLKEESPTESFKQMCSFIVGIMLISIVGNIFE